MQESSAAGTHRRGDQQLGLPQIMSSGSRYGAKSSHHIAYAKQWSMHSQSSQSELIACPWPRPPNYRLNILGLTIAQLCEDAANY
jgi:hypothetical protein